MTYQTHVLTGVTTALLISECIQEPGKKLLFIGAAGIGALLPDVDTKKSFIRKFIPFFFPLKHRGHTHSIVGLLIFSLIIIPCGINSITTGLIWGYLSHILADSFTITGTYPFYPQEKIRLKLAEIRTGGPGEDFFAAINICVMFLFFYFKLKGVSV